MTAKPETALVRACLDYLALVDRCFCWRNNSGAYRAGARFVRFGYVGSADILGVVRGRFLAVECKAGKNVQSDSQLEFQAAVERCGGVYVLAYSVEDVAVALSRLAT